MFALNKCAAAAAVIGACLAMASCGESEKPLSNNPTERAIQVRHRQFEEIGDAFKVIDDEIKANSPNQKKMLDAANKIATLGAEIPTWFPVGTGPEAGFETLAKPAIWSDNAQFLKVHEEFKAEAAKLVHAASGDNIADLTAQYYTTGVACANCHKPFRVEKPGLK